ncbi:MAG: glycosyltransferase family 1 protein [Chloroflexota bacterium]
MIIGIDASRATVRRRTGTEGYSLNVICGLLEQGAEHRFRLYFRDDPPEDLFPTAPNVEHVVIRRKRLWTHVGLRHALRSDRPDVLFVPAHVVPWPNTMGVPAVVTIHDLGYLYYPEKHPLLSRLYLNWSTRHSARTARRVIAVSKATAHDLVALNGVPEEKIRVVYSGVDKILKPVKDEAQIERLRQRLGIPGPYLLHVGSLQPRKNLTRLLEAFDQIKNTAGPLTLVLAGQHGWEYHRFEERIKQMGLNGRVILPGYVPDEDLAALYSGALIYVFPSLHEGFGFPVLEAMACGTPVVCANTSSLPELVGDAAMTVAPSDVYGMSEALLRLLNDRSLRQDLIKRGIERAGMFTWEACARHTLEVLVEAAAHRPR